MMSCAPMPQQQPGYLTRLHLVGAAVVAIAMLGGAVAQADPVEPSVPEVRPWVVLPFNVEDVPPEYLADGTEILDKVIAAELENRGIKFVQLSLVEGLRKWTDATEAIGGLIFRGHRFDYARIYKARRELVRDLLEDFNGVGVIWPDIHERKAQRVSGSLEWDGVSRPIPGPIELRRIRAPDAGSSIRLRVFNVEGEELSDDYFGLEVIHRMKVLKRERTFVRDFLWYEFPVRSDLFEDRELLSQIAEHLLAERLH